MGVALLVLALLGGVAGFAAYVVARLGELSNAIEELRREVARLGSAPRQAAQPEAPRPAVSAPPPRPSVPPERAPAPLVPPRPAVPAAPQAVAPPPPEPAAPPAPVVPPRTPPGWPEPSRPQPPEMPRREPPARPAPATAAWDASRLESVLGANWLSKVGVIALAVAAAFFLKYAFESGWISPKARVAIGGAAAVALWAIGQWLIRRPTYRRYAQVLMSGGVIILFLSVYAAYNYYRLIGYLPAFVALAIAAVAASALAARENAEGVALLCLAGAFLTPVLLHQEGVGRGDLARLYAYLAALDVWSLALVRYRNWRSLVALSFAATWLIFFGVGARHGPDFIATEAFALMFLAFSCYSGVTGLPAGEKPSPGLEGFAIAQILVGCAAFLIASARLLSGVSIAGLPALTSAGLLVALLFAGMATGLPQLSRDDQTVRGAFRYLSAAAVALLVGVVVFIGGPVPQSQALPAFGFAVLSYLVFLAVALDMGRRPGGAGPAVALVFANLVTHLLTVFRSLAAVQAWGIHAAPLWLPLASGITLAAIWFTSGGARTALRASLMVAAQAFPLAALSAVIALHREWPVGHSLLVFSLEFVVVSALWLWARDLTVLPWYRADLTAAFGNAFVFFGMLAVIAGMREHRGMVILSGCALGLAAYHALVAGVVLKVARDELLRRLIYWVVAITFLTIAIPLQLKASHITVAWAAEGAALIWAGILAGERRLRWYGAAVLVLAAAKALAVDIAAAQAPLAFLVNPRMMSGAAVIAAAYLSAWLLTRAKTTLSEQERKLPEMFTLLATSFIGLFGSIEFWQLVESRWSAVGRQSAQHFALSTFWSAFAAAVAAIGVWRRSSSLRALGLMVLALAVVKVVLNDLVLPPTPFRVLLNTRLWAGLAVAGACYFTAFTLWRREAVSASESSLITPLVIAGHVLALLFVSVDLWVHVSLVRPAAGRASAQHFALTLFWAAFALAVLRAGVVRANQAQRTFALCLLALVLAKVGLIDLLLNPAPFRFLLNTRLWAGLAVAGACYFTAFMLWRREAVSASESSLITPLVIAGHVLALLFISVDLWAHVALVLPAAGRASAQHFALTLFWAAFALAVLRAGVVRANQAQRTFALCLLALVLGKVGLMDLLLGPARFRFLLNTRLWSGATAVIAGAVAAGLLRIGRNRISRAEASLSPYLILLANLFALVFLSVDLWQYLGAALPVAAQRSAQQLALSIFWSLYAFGGLSVGIWRRSRSVRLCAMGLLYLAIVKVFAFDLGFLEQPYRILSFFGLGVILLVVSWLYTKFEERVR